MDYNTVLVDLQNKPAEFVKLYALANPLPNARAKVPLLRDDNNDNDEENEEQQDNNNDSDASIVLLCESLVVAEYIAERYCPELLPPTAHERATMRLFTELCGSSCFSYFALLRTAATTRDGGEDEQQLEEAIKEFHNNLVSVNVFLTNMGNNDNDSGPFLFGNRFTLAESNAAPFVQRACTILPALLSDDVVVSDDDGGRRRYSSSVVDPMEICNQLGLIRLKQWMEAVLSRPSVVATSVAKEDLIQSTSKMLKRLEAMERTK